MIFPIKGTNNFYYSSMGLHKKPIKKADEPKKEISFLDDCFKTSENEKRQKIISRIYEKLMRGEELTASELDFLKKYAPDLYSKAIQITEERRELEQRLRRAKTKREVEQIKSEKITSLVTQMKHDPEFTGIRLKAIDDVFRKEGNNKKDDEQKDKIHKI